MSERSSVRAGVQTPGVCANLHGCTLARTGKLVFVPLGAEFLCSLCGEALQAPVQETLAPARPARASLPFALVGAVFFLLGGASFFAREIFIAEGERGPEHRLYQQMAAAFPDKLPPLIWPPAQAAQAAHVAAAASHAPAVPLVAATAAPAAPVAPPVPAAVEAAPAPAPEAVAEVVAAPPSAPVVPAMASVVVPAGAEPVQVAGGSPDYPAGADGMPGIVRLKCTISATGLPTNCHVNSVKGGSAFTNAAMDWLRTGRVRFVPILSEGAPVAATLSWNMTIGKSFTHAAHMAAVPDRPD